MKERDKRSYDEVNTQWIETDRILPCLTATNAQRSMIFTTKTEKEQLGELCLILRQLMEKLNDKKILLDNLVNNDRNNLLLKQLFRNFLTHEIENEVLKGLKRILIIWLLIFDQDFETSEKMDVEQTLKH